MYVSLCTEEGEEGAVQEIEWERGLIWARGFKGREERDVMKYVRKITNKEEKRFRFLRIDKIVNNTESKLRYSK